MMACPDLSKSAPMIPWTGSLSWSFRASLTACMSNKTTDMLLANHLPSWKWFRVAISVCISLVLALEAFSVLGSLWSSKCVICSKSTQVAEAPVSKINTPLILLIDALTRKWWVFIRVNRTRQYPFESKCLYRVVILGKYRHGNHLLLPWCL